MKYIHEISAWPDLHWDNQALASVLGKICHKQGFLLGRLSQLGFSIQSEAALEVLTSDIINSSAIEGEILEPAQVRSSLAKRLGVDIGGVTPMNRNIDGFVEMMLDATQNYVKPLTEKRLFAWHGALFPTGRSGLREITVADWRTKSAGPMQVVSGPIGREHIHFEAPDAECLKREMSLFLKWFNENNHIDPVIKAGVAHFWFVTIHPFEDGNGRIARAIADLCLARADNMPQRFYSMSTSIENHRKDYYEQLETAQKGELDITSWLLWFLACLEDAIDNAGHIFDNVMMKAKLWDKLKAFSINDRQKKVVNLLLGNFNGHLTCQKYAKLTKCSHDTALRDIQALIDYGVMRKNPEGGRSASYQLSLRHLRIEG